METKSTAAKGIWKLRTAQKKRKGRLYCPDKIKIRGCKWPISLRVSVQGVPLLFFLHVFLPFSLRNMKIFTD
jgi:hypothetical protein